MSRLIFLLCRTCFFRLTILLPFVILPQNLISQNYPKHEMRAAWFATVNNIDWPSKKDLSTGEQQKEMIGLLDLMKEYNLNTVVFQVRPAADAFYPSSLEPWSQWLNGVQGKAPEPYYDPLEFVIAECRKRGLDIHAWLNPYRAVKDTADTTASNHITRIHPEWFLTYGRTVYFDPGLQETRDYVSKVVSDVVRRYDIDAIHMDDYFYPYRIANVSFPDDSIKAIKPWVEFGISPFGVWRNRDKDTLGSATQAGVTNYDDLFADILLWQKNDWIDYVTPQIYWHIGFKVADYSVLSDWWSHNASGCRLYIGQAPYRIGRKVTAKEWRTSKEIVRQLEMNRTFPNINGSMFFSAKVLRNNPLRLKERLSRDMYRFPSLPPANSRIVPIIPQMPSEAYLAVNGDSIHLSWEKGDNTKKFIIYKLRKGKPADLNDPKNIFLVTSEISVTFTLNNYTDISKYFYVVTSQSQTNTESEPEYFTHGAR
ncbi:MAG: family 10 glycosylhydrolase [Bacteroidales bacterium]|nr:family 10 glycosylhydrolase [Bacteroidales bacterium]